MAGRSFLLSSCYSWSSCLQILLLYLFCSNGAAAMEDLCCQSKVVEGTGPQSGRYSLVLTSEAVPGFCLDGCVYIKEDDPNPGHNYCFKSGEYETTCSPEGNCRGLEGWTERYFEKECTTEVNKVMEVKVYGEDPCASCYSKRESMGNATVKVFKNDACSGEPYMEALTTVPAYTSCYDTGEAQFFLSIQKPAKWSVLAWKEGYMTECKDMDIIIPFGDNLVTTFELKPVKVDNLLHPILLLNFTYNETPALMLDVLVQSTSWDCVNISGSIEAGPGYECSGGGVGSGYFRQEDLLSMGKLSLEIDDYDGVHDTIDSQPPPKTVKQDQSVFEGRNHESCKCDPVCEYDSFPWQTTCACQGVTGGGSLDPMMVHLKGGNGYSNGNVFAMNSNGYFGPVCDDFWDYNDANVVCQQLGFSGGSPTYQSYFGSVPEKFAMDDVLCSGSESFLQECGYDLTDNCSSYEGAGVECYTDDETTTMTPSTGTPESNGSIYWYNEDGERFNLNKFFLVYAKNIRRSDKYPICDSNLVVTLNYPGNTTNAINRTVPCVPPQSPQMTPVPTFSSRPGSVVTDSPPGNVSGSGTTSGFGSGFTLNPFTVKLIGGNGYSDGNVFVVNSDGYFGPVCDDSWDSIDSNVVCGQLGFFGGLPTMRSYFGPVPEKFAMDDVSCSGPEMYIQECIYNPYDNCSPYEGAGVQCFTEESFSKYMDNFSEVNSSLVYGGGDMFWMVGCMNETSLSTFINIPNFLTSKDPVNTPAFCGCLFSLPRLIASPPGTEPTIEEIKLCYVEAIYMMNINNNQRNLAKTANLNKLTISEPIKMSKYTDENAKKRTNFPEKNGRNKRQIYEEDSDMAFNDDYP